MKKGFTLAETLIVLVVIGILAAILLPVARNIAPDRNLMKFKKAHNTLLSTIRELVQSEEYYLNGDLGVKVNGNLVDNAKYFCETFSDVINIKKKNCSEIEDYSNSHVTSDWDADAWGITVDKRLDEICKFKQATIPEEMITSDGVVYYRSSPATHFGSLCKCIEGGYVHLEGPIRLFGGAHYDYNGLDRVFLIFCMDIDDFNKGEDPFGYAIRADGKMMNGARASEWLEKE